MTLKTSTTGSYPPIYDLGRALDTFSPEEIEVKVRESIERAIKDQLELGIDILVDGQFRDDIVSLFAKNVPGLTGNRLPYKVEDRIRPLKKSITVDDYQYAASLIPKDDKRPLKAHVTGPLSIARGLFLDTSYYDGIDDEKLIFDLAEAVGQEANYLVQAGAEIVQIDEPVLAKGVDLDLAFKAMEIIIKIGKIPFPALHACGNITSILDDVLERSPVKMVSIEGEWLKHRDLKHISQSYLQDAGKVIGLGCIKVNDYQIERILSLQNFLDQMISRLGDDRIWAITPNCGLRPVPYHVVKEKLRILVQASKTL